MWFALRSLQLSKHISFFCGVKSSRNPISYQNASSFSNISSSRAFSSHFDFLNAGYNTNLKKNLEESKEIYVGNIAYNTTEKEIRDYFGKFGRIKRISLLNGPDGSFIGKAFIIFDNPESGELALQANSKPLNGRDIEVTFSDDWSKEKTKIDIRTKSDDCYIYIKNLPISVGADLLKQNFAKFGKILDISVKDQSKPHVPPGVAFIVYESSEMAKAAVENMNGKELERKIIAVSIKERKDSRRKENEVFIGDLPGLTTAEELEKLFGHCGMIEKIILKGIGLGYAFIEFKTTQGAQNALKMDKHNYKGFPIKVDSSEEGGKYPEDPSKLTRKSASSIFIPKIPSDLTISDLKEFFSQFGPISHAAIPTLSNGRIKGHAFVVFNDIEVAKKLIADSMVIYEGEELSITAPSYLQNKNKK